MSASAEHSLSSPSSRPASLAADISSRLPWLRGCGWNLQYAVLYDRNLTLVRSFSRSVIDTLNAASHLLSTMTTASIPAPSPPGSPSPSPSPATRSDATRAANSGTVSASSSGNSSAVRLGSSSGSSCGLHSVTCSGASMAHCTPVAFVRSSFLSVMK